ncbi:hypothetical protein FA15DRAFT_400136 [Coprinopsis marcescibilis]|uniref:Ankyrin n=1 Tax=Coprinopsis marcescibilis TaxID=230819 RepID=A0A5C3L9P1_COPMA|nr:hypothetical protein FA15DRAFT_400136 [Coprinopsis marcescibilis]
MSLSAIVLDNDVHGQRGEPTDVLRLDGSNPTYDVNRPAEEEEDDDDAFVYPGNLTEETGTTAGVAALSHHPSPAQLESLCAAASSGDFVQLQRLFKTATDSNAVQPFNLANDASTRTGQTVLHTAASRGHLAVVAWRKFVFFEIPL